MRRLELAAMLAIVCACKGAESPSSECLGYDCDEDGAKKMFWDTVDEVYKPSEAARAAFEGVFAAGAAQMAKEEGFTPDGFDLARNNLRRFLQGVPEGGDDPLAPEVQKLKEKTSGLCPLWPYC
jgi:hypothetical protein